MDKPIIALVEIRITIIYSLFDAFTSKVKANIIGVNTINVWSHIYLIINYYDTYAIVSKYEKLLYPIIATNSFRNVKIINHKAYYS